MFSSCYNHLPRFCCNPFAKLLVSKSSRISSFLFLSLRLISYTKSKKSHLMSFCSLFFSGFKILFHQHMSNLSLKWIYTLTSTVLVYLPKYLLIHQFKLLSFDITYSTAKIFYLLLRMYYIQKNLHVLSHFARCEFWIFSCFFSMIRDGFGFNCNISLLYNCDIIFEHKSYNLV
jgi:hypothetical protein